jgi:hypothetical protein
MVGGGSGMGGVVEVGEEDEEGLVCVICPCAFLEAVWGC